MTITRERACDFYLSRNVLRSLDDVSWMDLNASMVPCLLIVWIITYFCVCKGAKYLGKVGHPSVCLSTYLPVCLSVLMVLFSSGVSCVGVFCDCSTFLPAAPHPTHPGADRRKYAGGNQGFFYAGPQKRWGNDCKLCFWWTCRTLSLQPGGSGDFCSFFFLPRRVRFDS